MRPRAAGATWTCRTSNARWAARYSHTTVTDAAGAIYVIGGNSGTDDPTYYNDVWVSVDKGADLSDSRGSQRRHRYLYITYRLAATGGCTRALVCRRVPFVLVPQVRRGPL